MPHGLSPKQRCWSQRTSKDLTGPQAMLPVSRGFKVPRGLVPEHLSWSHWVSKCRRAPAPSTSAGLERPQCATGPMARATQLVSKGSQSDTGPSARAPQLVSKGLKTPQGPGHEHLSSSQRDSNLKVPESLGPRPRQCCWSQSVSERHKAEVPDNSAGFKGPSSAPAPAQRGLMFIHSTKGTHT